MWWHARGRENCRGESGCVLYRVGTYHIRRGRRAARSSTSQGSAEPVCARIEGANREVSDGKADFLPRSVFFLRRPTRSGERARFMGLFQDAQGFGRLDAGSPVGFTSSRPPPSCVCVCVCFFSRFILDIKFVGRTSRGHTGVRSHRTFHPPSFSGACLNFSREKDSAIPFPRRP